MIKYCSTFLCPISVSELPLFNNLTQRLKASGSKSILAIDMVESRNWKEYNNKLINRGRVINIYISADLCRNDDIRKINKKKFGRPYEYTDATIFAAYSLKSVFHFGYRQIQGFIEDVAKYVKRVQIPNFRTIWWRIKKFSKDKFVVQKNKHRDGKIDIAIDSTGVKSTNAGEYMTYMYQKRKEWIKLHIVVDIDTHDILNARVTKRKVGDSKEFKRLIDPISDSVLEIYGDGAYDTNDLFEYAKNKGIYPNIAVHVNASKKCSKARRKSVIEQLGIHGERGTRDIVQNYTKEYRRKHQEEWRKKVHHGRRWAVETVFSSFKQMFGESVSAKNFDMIQKELGTKVLIYNKLR